jgi:hypothetical protein
MEGRRSVGSGAALIPKIYDRIWTGPPRKVDRVLTEGDEVAGFRVVHAPGHARGEVIFFRDSDRVAICGDVVRNLSYLTGRSGVLEPPDEMTYDPATARRSPIWPNSPASSRPYPWTSRPAGATLSPWILRAHQRLESTPPTSAANWRSSG